MEHLDKLIPLAILGVVGAFLVFLVRRVARTPDAAPQTEVAPQAAVRVPETSAAPAVVENVVTATLAVPEPEMPSPTQVLRTKRKKAPVPSISSPTVQTPIVTVLDLLKK